MKHRRLPEHVRLRLALERESHPPHQVFAERPTRPHIVALITHPVTYAYTDLQTSAAMGRIIEDMQRCDR